MRLTKGNLFVGGAWVGSVDDMEISVNELRVADALVPRQHYDVTPEITAEFNNCPTHCAVDKDHRCSQFDGVLRDGFTGEIVPDAE